MIINVSASGIQARGLIVSCYVKTSQIFAFYLFVLSPSMAAVHTCSVYWYSPCEIKVMQQERF